MRDDNDMGFYLNSAAPCSLYRSEAESSYFVDKSMLLEELFPFVEQGNKHICITSPHRFGNPSWCRTSMCMQSYIQFLLSEKL